MGNAQIGSIKDVEKVGSKKPSTTITIEAMDHCWEVNFHIIDQSPTLISLFQEIPRTGKSVEVVYDEINEDLDPMDIERALRFFDLSPKEIKKNLNIIGIPDLLRGLFLAHYLQSKNLIEGHQLRILQILMAENFFMFYERCEELHMDDFKVELYKILRAQFDMWKENEVFLKSFPRNFLKSLLKDGRTLTSAGEIGLYRTMKKWISLQDPAPALNFENYKDLISEIRFQNIIMCSTVLQELEKDGLLPRNVLNKMKEDMFMDVIRDRDEPFPYVKPDIVTFYRSCYRLGAKERKDSMRWVFYNGIFGHTLEFFHIDNTIYACRKLLTNSLVDSSEETTFSLQIFFTDWQYKVLKETAVRTFVFPLGKNIRITSVPEAVKKDEYHFFLLLHQQNKFLKPSYNYFDLKNKDDFDPNDDSQKVPDFKTLQ
ncbi:hypothetical protein FO519_002198 [Halicephalobus sp. NKZ332]|nr:hypothetical protein FO519_002198 [Halicephalobus sp. NKZ332]